MSTPQEMHDCPNDETLAAFIDGHLEGAARDAVIEHLVTCDECRSVCQGAWEYQQMDAPAGGKVLRPHFRHWRLYAAAAAMVIVVGGAVGEPKWTERRLAKEGIVAVNETQQRSIDGRLFGEDRYREHPEVTRSGKGEETDDPASFDRALMQIYEIADEVEKEAKKHPTARNLHTLGVAQLALATGKHRVEYLDAAITALDTAATKSPDDLALLNDRAAAYAARGNYNRPADVEKAIELAERAWKLKRTSETAWNRAVALNSRRGAVAIAAWNDYLKIDSSSGWAEKAKEKRDRLVDSF